MAIPPAPPFVRNLPVVDQNGMAGTGFADFLQKLWAQLQALQTTVDGLSSLIVLGSGDPNGVVTGSPPDLYLNLAGGAGTTLWVKESGDGTTSGWIGK